MAGLLRMLGLEEILSSTANRVYREQLEAVARWGRKQGEVQCDDEVSLPLYVDGELDDALIQQPELPLVVLDEQTHNFGPTYLRKSLLFAASRAIDTRLVTVFGRNCEGWVNLWVRSGSHIARSAGWQAEFGTWVQILRWLAHYLNGTEVPCPHPEAYVECGLRSGGQWWCADVETALFSYATFRTRSSMIGSKSEERDGR